MTSTARSFEIVAAPERKRDQRLRDTRDAGQPELDLLFVLRTGVPAVPRPKLRLVRSDEAPTNRRTGRDGIAGRERDDPDDLACRRPTATAQLPDPATWAARLTQAIIEVRSGLRPHHQLSRWICHDVMQELRTTLPRAASGPQERMHVTSVHVGQPSDGVVEACAVVVGAARSLAVALRLEGWDGRWICVSADVI